MSEAAAGTRFLPALHGLSGSVHVPGDKSISHRAVLLGAVNDGPVTVSGFLRSEYVSHARGGTALGVTVEQGEELLIWSRGGAERPADVIDVRNSGTLPSSPGLVARSRFSVFSQATPASGGVARVLALAAMRQCRRPRP
jgi:5-enolpyruvylshikimate-3-phosphate synthase